MTNGAPASKPAISTSRAVVAVVALSLSLFALSTVENLPVGLLPDIAADLKVSRSTVGLLVTGYALVVTTTSVPLAHLTRRVPRRYLLSGLLAVFVAATVGSAIAQNYATLFAARLSIALAHAVFWSVVAATAVGLFPPQVRGRVVSGLFTGATLASVLGIPVGTWLGQNAGWRTPFLLISSFGLLALIAIAAVLPTTEPAENHAATGAAPCARRFWLLVVSIILMISGVFSFYTYVTAFLTDVGGLSAAAISPVLLGSGVAGIVGTALAGASADRRPRATVNTSVGLLTAALFGMYLLGHLPAVLVLLIPVMGLSMSSLNTAMTTRILQVAPGSSDIASAIGSSAFNIGIASGSFFGGLLLTTAGVRSTALLAGVLSAAALAILLSEPLLVPEKPR